MLNKQWAKEVGKILCELFSVVIYTTQKLTSSQMLLVYCQVILVLVIYVLPRGRKDRWRFFLICRKRKKIKLKKRYEDSIVKCHQHTKEASNQDQGLTAQLAKKKTTINKRKKERNVQAERDQSGPARQSWKRYSTLYTCLFYFYFNNWLDWFV